MAYTEHNNNHPITHDARTAVCVDLFVKTLVKSIWTNLLEPILILLEAQLR